MTRRPLAAGSKSEHPAVMLETEAGEFVLRRLGGNPFRDGVLEALVGKRIEGTGERKGNLVILKSLKAAKER